MGSSSCCEELPVELSPACQDYPIIWLVVLGRELLSQLSPFIGDYCHLISLELISLEFLPWESLSVKEQTENNFLKIVRMSGTCPLQDQFLFYLCMTEELHKVGFKEGMFI